ncbi:MAG TPA: hypothetical protein VJ919_09705 [Tangfeifania sp.]|nr:hypothetical protein [Tangfeifania sp.]
MGTTLLRIAPIHRANRNWLKCQVTVIVAGIVRLFTDKSMPFTFGFGFLRPNP